MNRERCLALADIIESDQLYFREERLRFDMRVDIDIDHECGSTACIAGFSAVAFRPHQLTPDGYVRRSDWKTAMREDLSLSYDQTNAVYMGVNLFVAPGPCPRQRTAKQAAAMLRRLAETEAVIWDE